MIGKTLVAAVALALAATGAARETDFDRNFEDATLRIDYFHVGNT